MATLSNRKQFLFWIAAALIATAALIAVLLWVNHSAPPPRAVYLIGDPQKGAALFFGAKQCGTCHAVNGSGGHVAPDLSEIRPGTPAMGWLTSVLWNHAPGMWRQMNRGSVAFPHLSSEEMANILAFLYQASNGDRPGDAQAGRKVFEDKDCVRCHSVRGSGGKLGPELSSIAPAGGAEVWVRAMWNHAQSMVDPIMREVGHWPQFSGNEMNDLIAYVTGSTSTNGSRSQPVRASAERGWAVFQSKCMQCHSVRGKGGGPGPELGPEHELPSSRAEFAGVLWNHAPAMLKEATEKGVAPPLLQGDELVDLQTFLASLRYFEPAGSALVGERVFSDRGCARCHGAEAQGTRSGPALRSTTDAFTTVSFAAALWKHSPSMINRAEELGIPWPELQPADIGDLISFLNSPPRQK